jgi:uncharacterized protein (DUF1800 family)
MQFRQRANGNLRDILIAIAQDPAMLIWLDNKDNVKGKPNENFAREVMELFTMVRGRATPKKISGKWHAPSPAGR